MTEQAKITDFTPDKHNANKGTEKGAIVLDDSIQLLGLGRSIVVDKHDNIIAGNKTQETAVQNGLEDAIVIETDGSKLVVVKRTDLDLYDDDDDRARMLGIYDNRSSELNLEWDKDNLDLMLQNINSDSISVQAALSELAQENDLYFGEEPELIDPEPQIDRAEELQEKWQVKRGDLWQIGEHKLLCGDSTVEGDVSRVMGGELAQGCFTSPPYAEQRKRQYGGIPSDEYVDWWEDIQKQVKKYLTDNGCFFVNIKPHVEDIERTLYVFDLVIAMKRQWGWSYIDEFCWLRAGMPKIVRYRFKNAFEPIYQFSKSKKDFVFNPKDVMHYSENVPIAIGEGAGNTNWAGWQGSAVANMQGEISDSFNGRIEAGMAYPSNVLKAFSNNKSLSHPAAFAIQLAEFFIKCYSNDKDIWYEPFAGSGTVAVACEQLNRKCRMIEISEKYCAVILERMSEMGLEPELVEQ